MVGAKISEPEDFHTEVLNVVEIDPGAEDRGAVLCSTSTTSTLPWRSSMLATSPAR